MPTLRRITLVKPNITGGDIDQMHYLILEVK
jgi:hypothetical protein